MRRHAGISVGWLAVVATALAGACTRTWVLPGASMGGAPALDASTTDTGGASGRGGAPGSGGRGPGGLGGTGVQVGGRCPAPQETVGVHILTTDLIFVVARNMSMSTKFGDTTRMSAVQTALHNLIQTYQNSVHFGYAEFPSFGTCPNANTCCVAFNEVMAEPKNLSAIDQTLHQCEFGMSQPQSGCVAQNDWRPIAQTLNAVPTLWGEQSNDPTIVMILDGPPGCPFDDPSQSCQTALNAVSMLSPIAKTYVAALGQDAQTDPCLQKLAGRGATQMGLISIPEAGSTGPTGMDAVAAVTGAIEWIVRMAADPSCTIQLDSEPAKMGLVSVFIGGTEVNFNSSDKNDRNGWNFVKNSSIRIQLSGSSCQALRSAKESDVWARYGCAPCGEMYPCP